MIKRVALTCLLVLVNCAFVFSQSQATTAKQSDKDGIQCSSTGVGIGKTNQEAAANAEINRELAEQKSRKKRKTSTKTVTNEKGGGVAVCQSTQK